MEKRVFLLYDSMRLKFNQKEELIDALPDGTDIICYGYQKLVSAFLSKIPSTPEGRRTLTKDHLRDLWETFSENHYIAFGKVCHISDLKKEQPKDDADAALAEYRAKNVRKGLGDIVEQADESCIMHDFSNGTKKRTMLGDNDVAIGFTGSEGKLQWRLLFPHAIRDLCLERGYDRLLVREDKQLNTLHFVFNSNKGVLFKVSKNNSARLGNKALTDFLFDYFKVPEEQRIKKNNILKLSEQLAKDSADVLTYRLLRIE